MGMISGAIKPNEHAYISDPMARNVIHVVPRLSRFSPLIVAGQQLLTSLPARLTVSHDGACYGRDDSARRKQFGILTVCAWQDRKQAILFVVAWTLQSVSQLTNCYTRWFWKLKGPVVPYYFFSIHIHYCVIKFLRFNASNYVLRFL